MNEFFEFVKELERKKLTNLAFDVDPESLQLWRQKLV